jgi:hypothetical protein
VQPTETTPPILEPTDAHTNTLLSESVIALDLELPEGDSESGFTPALRFRCYGCHVDPGYATFGPRFESSAEIPVVSKRGELRIKDPVYDGRASTNREYILESILLPEAHVVEGEWEVEMPIYFGDIIEAQDLADIIAWMDSLE